MLAPGTRLGSYEVMSTLGVGGMGEVYRARDTRLQREVAIKVLPEAFALDADRLARFEREAQLLASLNHPNIAQIYGIEEFSGTRALMMELVDGPTLADRIAQGPVPLAEALPIAKQIAEALEAAHEHGIIHRDLKPANIKVRDDGAVKVLDFGLAKALDGGASGASRAGEAGGLTHSPTLSVHATMAGVILGTAAYMSPEQARGRNADRRADIWAFGVVLYEMLTGRRAFDGDDLSMTLANVLKIEPDWIALPADTPLALRRLLRRCLQKDPRHRLQAIGDARIEIDDAIGDATDAGIALPAASRVLPLWRRGLPWALASLFLIGIAMLSVVHFGETEPVGLPETRLDLATGPTPDAMSFALAPDGRQIVFVGSADGPARLWLRLLSATTAQPLAGTEGATSPFWSPDSRSIAFVAEGRLKRLDVGGGAPQVLAAALGRGGTWNEDGVILFASAASTTLFRVGASGGTAVPATKLNRQTSHRWPQFLPDRRHFVFWAQGGSDTTGIYLGSLDSEVTTRLTAADSAPAYLPSGWLLWVRAGTLVAQRLDLSQRALTGDPVTVADGVGFDSGFGAAAFSASSAGVIAYRAGDAGRRQLRWFDRAGTSLGELGGPDQAAMSTPRVTPDGRRALVSRSVQGNTDVWMVDGTRMTRLTFDPAVDRGPVVARDGTRYLFDSTRKQSRDLYLGTIGSPGSETLVVESADNKAAGDWSPDGRFHLYHVIEPRTGVWDLWLLPLGDEQGKPWPFLNSTFEERAPMFSPDGKWVVYQSNESGRHEVYVRQFVTSPNDGSAASPARAGSSQWQVSTAGGIRPTWRADGNELYYLDPDGRLMAARVISAGDTFDAGAPVPLFQTRIVGGGIENGQGRQFDVARDGRFLVNTLLEETAAPITILQNWNPPAANASR